MYQALIAPERGAENIGGDGRLHSPYDCVKPSITRLGTSWNYKTSERKYQALFYPNTNLKAQFGVDQEGSAGSV
jgi:hypothetical protein